MVQIYMVGAMSRLTLTEDVHKSSYNT